MQTQTDSATYDAADRQTSTTDNGLTTRYGYDAASWQRTHTIADGATLVTTSLDAEWPEGAGQEEAMKADKLQSSHQVISAFSSGQAMILMNSNRNPRLITIYSRMAKATSM